MHHTRYSLVFEFSSYIFELVPNSYSKTLPIVMEWEQQQLRVDESGKMFSLQRFLIHTSVVFYLHQIGFHTVAGIQVNFRDFRRVLEPILATPLESRSVPAAVEPVWCVDR